VTIERIDLVEPVDGLPRISSIVIRGDLVFLYGVTADPVGDIRTQTPQVLRRIDRLLAKAGTNKSKLLTAQVWLSDMRLFDDHNAVWNDWVDHDNPPVRACVGAVLWQPNKLVEIMVTAEK
jgi:enamine deaminase RidA (YjgF/YER057c/UK114 family)